MTWLINNRSWRRHTFQGWLFLMPLMVSTIVVIVLPTLATVGFSLTDWSGFGEVTFIGLENFRQLATDASFLQSLKHAVIWTVIF